MNELDALANIDFQTREEKKQLRQLELVRIGTCGGLQPYTPVGTFVCSAKSIGFDGLLNFYAGRNSVCDLPFERAFLNHMGWSGNMCAPAPYVIDASAELIDRIAGDDMVRGVTIAAGGFFGPQGRELRVPLADPYQNEKIEKFEYNGYKITNFEMESSALAGLSRLMGHKAMTVCRIHAMNPNRYIRNHEHLTRSPVQVVERFTDIDLPIIKILFEEDFPVLDAVRTFILSRPWGREYELIYSNDHLLELTAAGATKGGMILRLASLLGVARKDIYCIGDHKNDIPMLEVSAVPFAPANAIPAVHEFGAHIVSHCSDGAVADVVEYLDKIY